MIGKTISHYKVVDKLGEGGMGAVYKAEDTTLHRLVALKTLSGHLTEDEEAQKRFIREAQAASSLNHPNITTVYEFIEDDDTRLICMEYVEGKTIRDMVETGAVSVRKAIDIIMQAAEALEAAHNKGILHRDVKSANIMVNMEGRVKVMDFGLAHLEERSQLTRTGTTMGTLSYSSPEQISGRPIDRRSEVFSLGIVFYELLTGQLPFRATSEAEIVFAIINNEPPKLTKVREDVPELVEAVVARMLEKDHELRYSTMGEVIDDLQGIRKEMETSTVGIAGALERVQASRKKVLVQRLAAGVAVVAITAVGLILLTRGGPELDPNRIVVEVFENRTGDESLDILGSLAADVITRGIFEANLIGAVPFEESERMILAIREHGTPEERSNPLHSIALAYRAGTALTGSFYELDEDVIEFRLNLMDMQTGDYLFPLEPVSVSTNDRRALLAELHKHVMGVLAIQFDPEFSSFADITSTPPSPEAFKEFRNGLNDYFSSNWLPDSRENALTHFLAAARIDTNYLTPLIWAARCHIITTSEERRARADSILNVVDMSKERLHPLDQYMFDWLRSGLHGDLNRQYQTAVAAAKLVPGTMWSYDASQSALFINRPREALTFILELDPESAAIREWTGYGTQLIFILLRLQEYEEALKVAQDFREREPDSWLHIWHEIRTRAPFGEVEKIIELYEESRGLVPSGGWNPGSLMSVTGISLRGYGYLDEARNVLEIAIQWFESERGEDKKRYREDIAEALYISEKWEEARSLYEELIVEDPDNLVYHGYLGCLAARRGDLNEAQSHNDWLQERGRELIYTSYQCDRWCADIAAQLNKKEEALRLLQVAFEHGSMSFQVGFKFDLNLDPLRDYPPFQEWIRPKG